MRYSAHPHDPHRKWTKGRPFKCRDCNNVPDAPMLKDEVWDQVGTKSEILCIPCTERVLGREITVEDLRYCVANAFTFLLYDRMNK